MQNGAEVCDDNNTDSCGTCNSTCSQLQLAKATGLVTIVAVANIRDGDLLVLNDGINPVVFFEFDLNSDNLSFTVPIPFAAANPVSTVATSVATAINGITGTLAISASSAMGNVTLVHDMDGAFGNQRIETNARTSALTKSGMSGGKGANCSSGTECSTNADCEPDLVCRANKTCGP
jgi:hypothetical protein